jgi:hypothetical protein
VFWYFGTAFLRKSHHAGGDDLRSTKMILHRVGAATQGGFSQGVHSTLYAREASVAPATQFKRRYRKVTTVGWARLLRARETAAGPAPGAEEHTADTLATRAGMFVVSRSFENRPAPLPTPAEVWRPIVILFVGLALLRYFLVAVRVILPVFQFLFEFHDARSF